MSKGPAKEVDTAAFVRSLGVPDLPRTTCAFDPGYDPSTVISHLQQSGALIARLKLSMGSWLVADQASTQHKVLAARRMGVPVVTGGGSFEIARDRGRLEEFLELCQALGVDRIEAGEGFTREVEDPHEVVDAAARHHLDVQAELGEKPGGTFNESTVRHIIERGFDWLDAGATQIVVGARESEGTSLNVAAAEAFACSWGLEQIVFEAPTKKSQFEFISHFGPEVHLGNVRLEEILRVEIYRRGLHAGSYERELASRPPGPTT
ncbi:MAG: phosphosulfolactate synthase [Candidatus Dormiibacterota bacterium]